MKQGETATVEIVDLAYGGEGVARPQGKPVVFVAEALPGERVRIQITEVRDSYSRGKLLEIIQNSRERVSPPCPVYQRCGGCQLQHLEYSGQLRAKRGMILDSLERIAKISELPDFRVQGMDFPWNYRNKGQFPLGLKDDEIRAGFYRSGSHELVFFPECRIQDQPINRLLDRTVELLQQREVEPYREEKHQGELRHLLLRSARCTGQQQLTFITREKKRSPWQELAEKLIQGNPGLKGVHQNINPSRTNVILGEETRLLVGEPYITEYLEFYRFIIYPESFFQINQLMAVKLYDTVREMAGKISSGEIVDAYCGTGSIGIYLSELSSRLVGFDSSQAAIEAARFNARINGLEGKVKFHQAEAEEALAEVLNPASLLILDPPRSGLDSVVRKDILEIGPGGIIYVSCNPGTLARDLKGLKERYRISEISGIDMFPQTYHIETAVLLERKGG